LLAGHDEGIAMKHNKNLEQRTFLQDRFEILIKKQKTGQATFSELTELDDIVNKYATIREQILEEMHETKPPDESAERENLLYHPQKRTISILDKIRSFFDRMFIVKASAPFAFNERLLILQAVLQINMTLLLFY